MKYHCLACGYNTDQPQSGDLGKVRGNTLRFNKQEFHLWRCDACGSLIALDEVDLDDIYRDYPLTQSNPIIKVLIKTLFKRLERNGLEKENWILDYGCNEGFTVDLLKERGFRHVVGYDPYHPRFANWPTEKFDWIISTHVIEHEADPYEHLSKCTQLLKPKGKILLDTPAADNIERLSAEYIYSLHQPFHRVILSRRGLEELASRRKLRITDLGYGIFDTRIPFMNATYVGRFTQLFNSRLENVDIKSIFMAYLKEPMLLVYGLFGYWFPRKNYRNVVHSNYYLLERTD